ncbi:MAG: bifunctional riboflavin kinase/FAD synthetase [Chitinophagaceae bacterium]|nr:MAG: bifunctional riboflavin kinase/FAD synthetase [Chitinophagaceae bacterium]
MQVHQNIDSLPYFRKAVITIGTFDGVHSGHQQIINVLKSEAQSIQGETVIITFHPHPRKIVSSTILGVRLINTMSEKIELLEKLGVDHLVIVPFTDSFAHQPAADYIQNFLIEKFHPHSVIIGYDHRFGRDRLGDYLLLEQAALQYNFKLTEISKHILNQIAISSTTIRESILLGKVEAANELLGYDFFFEGEVVHGEKLGRKLGYPTANLKIHNEEKITPGDGIYAVKVSLTGKALSTLEPLKLGMMSIGFRPTVNGKGRVIEVNIFEFDEEIYGQTLRVYVKKYLRSEAKFNSLQELIDQIGLDKIESLKVLQNC